MYDIIQLLPDQVANQIAAGEVVQRPASVVKELLENAIDAKATSIQLILKDAGRTLIQVIDNGSGMSITDARMAFERHATSKIRTTQDIFSITSKGFRGEALASIAAVSQVELKSKRENDDIGTHFLIEGGETISQLPINHSVGSVFIVKNLFFNVPARRKFLKSNSVEYKHILDEFFRVILAHENITFHLFHNEEPIFRLKSGNLMNRIVDVFGKKIQNFLVPISEETDFIKITGFIAKPEAAKKSRGEQFFFVNKRFFRSNYFNKAVLDAFEGLLQPSLFPSFFIFLEINPEMIDVNIHPTKTEIKFEDESAIYGLIRSVIKRSIGVYNIVPSLDFQQDKEIAFFKTHPEKSLPNVNFKVNPSYNPFLQETNSPQKNEITNKIYSTFSVTNEVVLENKLFEEEEKLNCYRLQNGYWIWENNEIYMLDVYRIHQTILMEKWKNNINNAISQKLLFATEYPLSSMEFHKLESIKTKLFEKGFEMRIISDMAYFDALPSDFQQDKLYDFIDSILNHLEEHSHEDFDLFYLKNLVSISAKKKNEVLTIEQIKPLLTTFKELNMPIYNPFGKKNFFIVSLKEFES